MEQAPELELRDINSADIVGIQVAPFGTKIWVCVNGICVLRIANIKDGKVEITDMRRKPRGERKKKMMRQEYKLVIRLKYFSEPGARIPGANEISVLVHKALAKAGFDVDVEQILDGGFVLEPADTSLPNLPEEDQTNWKG